MVDGRERQTRPSQGVKGPLRERPELPTLTYRYLLTPSKGGFVKAPPCHMSKEQTSVGPWQTPVQDQDRADIIGVGVIHT